MDSKQVDVFMAVAECGSFAKCCDRLYLTRSSVKRHIDAIEDELGVCLFNRTPQHVELTEAGRALYQGLKEVVPAYEQLIERVRRLGNRRTIRFAYSPLVLIDGLPRIMQAYERIHPDVAVELKSIPVERFVAAIKHDEADVCLSFMTTEAQDAGLVLRHMDTFPSVCCYVANGDPLARRATVETHDLARRRVRCRREFLPHVIDQVVAQGAVYEGGKLDDEGFPEVVTFIQGGGVYISNSGLSQLFHCQEVPLAVSDTGCVGGLITRPNPPGYLVDFVNTVAAWYDEDISRAHDGSCKTSSGQTHA